MAEEEKKGFMRFIPSTERITANLTNLNSNITTNISNLNASVTAGFGSLRAKIPIGRPGLAQQDPFATQPRLGLTDAEVKKAIEGMTKEEAQEFMDKMTEMTLQLAKELDDIKKQEKAIASEPKSPATSGSVILPPSPEHAETHHKSEALTTVSQKDSSSTTSTVPSKKPSVPSPFDDDDEPATTPFDDDPVPAKKDVSQNPFDDDDPFDDKPKKKAPVPVSIPAAVVAPSVTVAVTAPTPKRAEAVNPFSDDSPEVDDNPFGEPSPAKAFAPPAPESPVNTKAHTSPFDNDDDDYQDVPKEEVKPVAKAAPANPFDDDEEEDRSPKPPASIPRSPFDEDEDDVFGSPQALKDEEDRMRREREEEERRQQQEEEREARRKQEEEERARIEADRKQREKEQREREQREQEQREREQKEKEQREKEQWEREQRENEQREREELEKKKAEQTKKQPLNPFDDTDDTDNPALPPIDDGDNIPSSDVPLAQGDDAEDDPFSLPKNVILPKVTHDPPPPVEEKVIIKSFMSQSKPAPPPIEDEDDDPFKPPVPVTTEAPAPAPTATATEPVEPAKLVEAEPTEPAKPSESSQPAGNHFDDEVVTVSPISSVTTEKAPEKTSVPSSSLNPFGDDQDDGPDEPAAVFKKLPSAASRGTIKPEEPTYQKPPSGFVSTQPTPEGPSPFDDDFEPVKTTRPPLFIPKQEPPKGAPSSEKSVAQPSAHVQNDSGSEMGDPFDDNDRESRMSRSNSIRSTTSSFKGDEDESEEAKRERRERREKKEKEKDPKKNLRTAKAQAKAVGPWSIILEAFFEPNDNPSEGSIYLRVGEMRNFHGPMFLKRSQIYVKAYLLLNSQPTKDSKRSSDMFTRSEELDFKQEFAWPIDLKSVSKCQILVGIWGHGNMPQRNIPLGEVLINVEANGKPKEFPLTDPNLWLTFKK